MKRPFPYLAVLLVITAYACTRTPQKPVNLIFETDMGNDVDDVIALDLIQKAQDAGKARLMMVGINKSGLSAAGFVDIMDTWYGYPDVPIGFAFDAVQTNPPRNFNDTVCALKLPDGTPAFKRSIEDLSALPPAHELYRKVLSAQDDNSVVIASVGFSTNLAKLMESGPDSYSPLDGMELIRKKVKFLSVMAGNFADTTHAEYNVVTDLPSAKKVLEDWPTPVVFSPFNVGIAIQYPATSIENDFTWSDPHPLAVAYKTYLPMPYDRATWDPTAVLYAIEGDKWFTVSENGIVTVDDGGHTYFTPDPEGNRKYLSVTEEQADAILKYFLEVVPQRPACM